MSEANKEVTQKCQNLFQGCIFRFKGLKSEIEKAFVNLVEDLGAEVSDDAEVTFVQKSYFSKKKNIKNRNLYDIGFIMDSVQAGKAILLDNYRFVPLDNDQHANDEPMCYSARYIYKTDSCHKYFYDKVFCIECAKQNKKSPIPSNRHRIVIAPDSSFENKKEKSESPCLILRKNGRDNEKVMQHESESKKRIIPSASDHSDSEEQSTITRKCLSKKRFKSSHKTVELNESSESEVENERSKRNSGCENENCKANSEKPQKVVSGRIIVERKNLGDDTSDVESNRNKNLKEVRNGNCGSPLNKRSPEKVVKTNIVGEIESDNDRSDAESSKLKVVKKSRNENCGSRLDERSPEKVVERNVVSETDSDDDFLDARTHKNKNLHTEAKKSSAWIEASTSKTSPVKMEQHLKALSDSDISIDTDDEEKLYFKNKKWWLNHEISKEEECKIPCCSYEPVPHRRHWQPKKFMSCVEKKIIVKYLIVTNSIRKAKGLSVFENMIKDGYLTHRTAESLRNVFRRTILKELENYGLSAETYREFASLKSKELRKMKIKQEKENEDGE